MLEERKINEMNEMEEFDYDFMASWEPEKQEPKTVYFGRRLWTKQPDGSWKAEY